MDDPAHLLDWLPEVPLDTDQSTLSDLMIYADSDYPETRHKIQLKFIDDREDVQAFSSENAARHRRSIFSAYDCKVESDVDIQDSERLAMSEVITRSVPSRNINKALSDLEVLNDDIDSHVGWSQFRGPFGAFRMSPQKWLSPGCVESERIKLPLQQWEQELEETLRGDEFEFDNLVVQGMTANDNWIPEEADLLPTHSTQICSLEPQLQPHIKIFGGNIEGWTLLSHYKDQIVPLISPLRRGQESPWISLVIPCAVTTLGELTINGSVNHARLALLNAVWGNSSFHLGNSVSCPADWKASGEMYLKRAQHHFQKCMEETCLSTSKKSKYKEILMAILSLSNAFMFKGDTTQRRAYLVQTEKFIRVRGLSQPKLSSKKRSLHHCYAFMRIIAETTCVANSTNLQLLEMNGETIDDTIYEGDFRISPNLDFSAESMTEEKDPEMGQRDLHLAIPGRWSSTLFPIVYGVDELFLMLLSQVIRLANERDLSTMCTKAQEEHLSLRSFWIRAKAIEKAINALIYSSATGDNHAHAVQDKSVTIQAMSMSLLIFFHRRVYEVDPEMIQCKVAIVRNYLMQIQAEETNSIDGNTAALIWPAFIAACEAVEPDLQLFFSSWFDYCFATTTLVYASAAKQIFETIWTKRSNPGLDGQVYSWPDILRESNTIFTCV
ncbi:uncharacterized protein N7511_003121 [Penicillium nucicola]|uniref:uncharacterized protein n=1 Tax=Penicillium nucicola TaxID=1850975 RepID=UPI0025450B9E|nr:uncharacterized protein N7511_003121 [Penicillium nucicola]KAJ5771070.1 hypothetical protein N7511_003121 [Penicillium nucicola]